MSDLRRKMSELWDQPSCFDAKYRRLVTWADIISSIEDEDWLEETWVASIEKDLGLVLFGLQPDPDWSVLEIGAGIGRLLGPLSEKVAIAYGVDISPAMVEFAREYLRDFPNAKVFLNDGRSLSMFESGMFDFRYSMTCFQHIPDVDMVRDYLQEIARVLKPQGLLRIQVSREAPVWTRMKRAVKHRNLSYLRGTASKKWRGDRAIDFEGNRYTRRSLQQLLGKAGLKAVDWHEGLGATDWLWVTAVKG